MTIPQYRTHFILKCVIAALFINGTDTSSMYKETKLIFV